MLIFIFGFRAAMMEGSGSLEDQLEAVKVSNSVLLPSSSLKLLDVCVRLR